MAADPTATYDGRRTQETVKAIVLQHTGTTARDVRLLPTEAGIVLFITIAVSARSLWRGLTSARASSRRFCASRCPRSPMSSCTQNREARAATSVGPGGFAQGVDVDQPRALLQR